MPVIVQDMEGVTIASTESEIEFALSTRYGVGVNEFWIFHENEKRPALCILVNGELASLSYFPRPRDSGFVSMGRLEGLQPGEFSTFYVNTPTEETLVLNDSIVPMAVAARAAKEFLAKKDLPAAVEWLEL